jgi:hypothetical protein
VAGDTVRLKKILIISPHFPPSNLAAVHRSRLFAQHLPTFGWQPIILTVDAQFYEEEPDENIVKLLPNDLRIEKVKAFGITKPRLIGDIGLRAFIQLTRRAVQLIREEQIHFLYIPIPSFYVASVGRIVHAKTKIPYGIDYIDPWVHTFAGSDIVFSRHWFSTKISSFLEPIAVKKAALITGVSEGYYKGVIERNPYLLRQAVFAAMPYGGEKADYEIVERLQIAPYLFQKKAGVIQLVYAGAMLPKAYKPLEKIMRAIEANPEVFAGVEFHFIGTGKSPTDENGHNIKPLAEKWGLWQSVMFEYPKRIPYLDTLVHLQSAHGVFVLGSTEPHYTPSKVYQGVLSKKPIWAVLHQQSSACKVIRGAQAGVVLDFDGEDDVDKVLNQFADSFMQYKTFSLQYQYEQVDQQELMQYSARSVTAILANALNRVAK